jgi:antitoxin ParD1/3/4
MGEISFSPEIQQWLASRVAQGGYADEQAYLLDLICRDMQDAASPETPEEIAWIREKVAEGLASGIVDRDPRDVLDEIIADRRKRHG